MKKKGVLIFIFIILVLNLLIISQKEKPIEKVKYEIWAELDNQNSG